MISQSLAKSGLLSSASKRHQIAQLSSPPIKFSTKFLKQQINKQDNVTSTQTGFLIQPMEASLNFFFWPPPTLPDKKFPIELVEYIKQQSSHREVVSVFITQREA